MKIEKPLFSLKDVFPTCINNFNRVEKKKKFEDIYPLLLEDEERYISALKTKQLHLERKEVTHDLDVSINDLVNLYKRKLLNNKLKAREYYDSILLSSDICPFCGKRHTSTVDHFLPKKKYPNFSITPINLVPCCKDCNKNKADTIFTKVENTFFHPYEDDIDSFRWLSATIEINNNVLMFNFFVIKDKIEVEVYKRLNNQFKILKLQQYYNVEANVKFKRTKKYYQKLFRRIRGREELEKHFEEEREKYSYDFYCLNSFEYVYYSVLLENLDIVISIL